MEEFMQKFRRVARESRYEGCPLIEEFKQGINKTIRRKLMEAKHQPGTVEQWYDRATALDWNWRESRREEEGLRGQREPGGIAPRQQEQRQIMPRPLVWQRRQEMPPQQVTTGPAPIEGVEKMNVLMVWPQQRIGLMQHNPHAIEVDRGRNCYACEGFGHMVQHCRSRRGRSGIMEGKRLEHNRRKERNQEYMDNLKEKENLEALN